MLRLLVASAGLGAAALAGGCGAAAPAPPTTVRGVVRFQGQPLAGGMVVFAPFNERGTVGPPVAAALAADGSFALRPEAASGVPAGWYRVALADPPAAPGSYPDPVPFPARLRRPDRSELLREVLAGRDNAFEFSIEVPPARGQ